MFSPIDNPMLNKDTHLPMYKTIAAVATDTPIQVKKCIKDELERAMCAINTLLQLPHSAISFENFVVPLECIFEHVHALQQPINQLTLLCNNEQIDALHEEIATLMQAFSSDFFQNQKAYKAFDYLASVVTRQDQKQALLLTLDTFQDQGIHLEPAEQKQLSDLQLQLMTLCHQFGTNVVKATDQYEWIVEESVITTVLDGLTPQDLDMLRNNAPQRNKDIGSAVMITLDQPCVTAIMSRCNNPDTRSTIYQASSTVASSGEFDNSDNITQILEKRKQIAELINFVDYAGYSTSDKMAASPDNVNAFFDSFGDIKKLAQLELNNLQQFATDKLGIDQINQTNRHYVMDQMQRSLFDFSNDLVATYFPTIITVERTFEFFSNLFDVNFHRLDRDVVETWHPDVDVYQVVSNKIVIGYLYVDLYTRQHKNGGAWMDNVNTRHYNCFTSSLILPSAHLVCNFMTQGGETPSLMTHSDVETLFHEMGHALHHLLTTQNIASVSGINGVQWDAVELPSQLMENWCWDKQVLLNLSGHYETGEPLPEDLIDKIIKAKHFCGALHLARQLEFSAFDMDIHTAGAGDPYDVLAEKRAKYNPINYPEYNRFAHAFTHIFSGGYGAGYYGYLWAELLSSDVFEAFDPTLSIDKETADKFKQHILQVGGSVDMNEAFLNFRGRAPEVAALLRHRGVDISDAKRI